MKNQHMEIRGAEGLELEKKLSNYERYLQDFYPAASLKFLYMCDGTHLEILNLSGQRHVATTEQKLIWKNSILHQNYSPLRSEHSLSILQPLYSPNVDCENMVVCICFPDSSLIPAHEINSTWDHLIFVSGYTGIFIVCILMAYFLKQKQLHTVKRTAWICASGIFLVGLLFSFQFSEFANQIEKKERRLTFENYASSITSRLRERLVGIETQSLQQLVAFIEASDEVTSEEFSRFTQDLTSSKREDIWFWIPAPLERETPTVKYNSLQDEDKINVQGPFPHDKALFEEILSRSDHLNNAIASEIHSCDMHEGLSIFVAHPTRDGEDLRGWVACSISVESLLKEAARFGNLNPNSVQLSLSEMGGTGQQPPASVQQNAFTRPVFIFERLYLIHAVPTPLYWTLYPMKLNIWVWGFGGIISLIVSIMVYQNLLRNHLLESKVKERTHSLDQLLTKHLNITNNLPLGLALCVDGVFCEMNPKMQTWFKTTDDLRSQLTPLIKEDLLLGKKVRHLIPLQTQFGNRQMKFTALKLPEDSGKKQLLILLEDWTEQLRSEQALSKKTIELERLFNSSTDLLCTSTLDGTFLNLNPQWEVTLGHPVSQMTGQKWIHFVHKEDRKQAEALLQRICDGAQTQNFTLRFEHRHGEEVWLEWKTNREGNLIHANVRDITARINAEEKNRNMREHVARAQKMESIGRLAGGIAHDFNNSLQVIIGNAQLVLNRPEIQENQKNQLQDLLKAADRSARLTRQLLGFAMKQHVQAHPTNLNEKLQEMEPMFNTILGDQIKIVWELSPLLARVKMDSGQLEQIAVSLLENARDAMPKGGVLTIKTENRDYTQALPDDLVISLPPGNYICFSIRDTGSGIDSAILGTLFEPFSTTQDPSKGSGLGLATLYGILQQNNGSVRVESQQGKGTLMEIYLPQLSETTIQPSPSPKATAASRKILVVDDNPQIISLASMMLKELHYQVVSSSSPVDALKIIEEDRDISLLLTDVLMPEITGQELYKEALTLRPELKCIFMSGYSSDVVEAKFLQSGKCLFLLKPFHLDALKEALSALL